MKSLALPFLVLLVITGCDSPARTPPERSGPTGHPSVAPSSWDARLFDQQSMRHWAWVSVDLALQECARNASVLELAQVDAGRQLLTHIYSPGGFMAQLYSHLDVTSEVFLGSTIDSLQLNVAGYSGEIVTHNAELTVYTGDMAQRSVYHQEYGEWTQKPANELIDWGQPKWAVRTTYCHKVVTSRVWAPDCAAAVIRF